MKMRALATFALAAVFAACSSKPEPEALPAPGTGFAPADTVTAVAPDTAAVNRHDVQVLDSLALQAYPDAPDSLYIEMAMKAERDSLRRAEGDTLGAPVAGDTLISIPSSDSAKAPVPSRGGGR